MKQLHESLLNKTFDIDLEPVDFPKMYAVRMFPAFESKLEYYNPIVEHFYPYHTCVEAMENFINIVEGSTYSNPDITDLDTVCQSVVHKAKKSVLMSERTYSVALNWVRRIKTALPALVEIDKICHQTNKIYDKGAVVQLDKFDLYIFFRDSTMDPDEALKFYNEVVTIAKRRGIDNIDTDDEGIVLHM